MTRRKSDFVTLSYDEHRINTILGGKEFQWEGDATYPIGIRTQLPRGHLSCKLDGEGVGLLSGSQHMTGVFLVLGVHERVEGCGGRGEISRIHDFEI